MKLSNTTNNKATLLTQTGLALTFFLSSFGLAVAEDATSPVSVMEQPSKAAQGSPAESIDAPIPGTPAPATRVQPAASAQPAAIPAQAAGAQPAPVPVPATASAVTGSPISAKDPAKEPSVAPVAKETLPSATKTEAAAQPSGAELAVPASQDPTAALAKKRSARKAKSAQQDNDGLRVTDILSTPANVRPLPNQYLIVKKEHNANDVDSRLTAARSALAQGSYQAALELFDDLYRKNPRDQRVSMGRAVALQKLGQTDEAMDAYQVALRNDPRNIEALTNMLGLLKGKDTPTALKKLQQLRDLYPANADVTAQLGMVYGVTGDYSNALKYLNMADALKPGNATVLYNKAVAYDHMGNTAEAAQLYHQILLLASDGVLDQSFPLEVVKQRLAVLR